MRAANLMESFGPFVRFHPALLEIANSETTRRARARQSDIRLPVLETILQINVQVVDACALHLVHSEGPSKPATRETLRGGTVVSCRRIAAT
jgi:hypothetical protein